MKESLQVALLTILDEVNYLDDALKVSNPPALKERFQAKRDHLVAAGMWIEEQLSTIKE